MNQTTNHTPGPWQVFNGGALIGTAENSDGSRYIADIRYIPGGESVSNARLIAAAPEMVDALPGLIECAENLAAQCRVSGVEEHARMYQARAEAGRAALAKATAND